jgi:hypothetical protein
LVNQGDVNLATQTAPSHARTLELQSATEHVNLAMSLAVAPNNAHILALGNNLHARPIVLRAVLAADPGHVIDVTADMDTRIHFRKDAKLVMQTVLRRVLRLELENVTGTVRMAILSHLSIYVF